MKKKLSAAIVASLATPSLLFAPASNALIMDGSMDGTYLQWAKVDEAGNFLPGSEWELTVNGGDGTSHTYTIKDGETFAGEPSKEGTLSTRTLLTVKSQLISRGMFQCVRLSGVTHMAKPRRKNVLNPPRLN